MTEKTTDLVILGGGSAGYSCALRAAQLGLSVVLVEKDRLGGTCLHNGCIPTKALLHAAEVADTARDGAEIGVLTRMDGIDMTAVHSYKTNIVDKLYKGLRGLVASRQIDLVEGVGRFVGPRSVEVADTRYTGRAVVLATGSYAKTLPGLEIGGRIVTSHRALELDAVPRHAIVLGGGVIGVEFASLWRSFGAEVTLVEAADRLLPGEDPSMSKALERAFRKRGITVRTGVGLRDAAQTADAVVAGLDSGERIEADVLLVAVGRGPNTTGHGFEEAGIALDRGWVRTDEQLRTTIDEVYAVGDIVAGPQLAHRGFQHGIFVAEQIAGLAPHPISDSGIPRVIYSTPEIASVGLTEAAAREIHGEISTVTYDLAGNGKSQILGTAGAVKLIKAAPAEQEGPVVGIHLIGARVGELIGEAQLIYNWQAEPADVTPFLHAHPSQNEALGEAFLALAGKPLHTHG